MKFDLLSGVAVGLSLHALAASAVPVQNFTVGAPVKTSSGTIVGHAARHRVEVSEYLAVPFAEPPVGELRFAAPNAVNNSSRRIEAKEMSSGCLAPPSSSAAAFGSKAGEMSEDCLYLNIWTKPQTGEKAKAVLFWIYGGAFQFGSIRDPAYDGEYFADNQDVVIVTANYRLNAFGFHGLAGAGIPQNPGLLDQRMAIEWVRDNIANFGGDPKRITLFGQSAGSASVDYYSYAYTADPIVNAFILQSGTATSYGNNLPRNNSAAWFKASSKLGCGDISTTTPSDSLTCIRTKSANQILNATKASNALESVAGGFSPTADDITVFRDYQPLAAAGKFIRRPVLLGSTDKEAMVFSTMTLSLGFSLPAPFWDLITQAAFNCPTAQAADARAKNGVPVWRYRYFGDFPNMRIKGVPDAGAYHASEIAVIWGTAGDYKGSPNTEEEDRVGAYLQGVWAAFAKDPERGLEGGRYGFPRYGGDGASLLEFARNDSDKAAFSRAADYDAPCVPIMSVMGALGGFRGGG
ncbi:alpha/beta-hydrolase [Aulographum hederae CBS 113979]|uniref:Carboxylic ester hydrolase n=1 Tax=Aulographum hederae CBS 113979 TaxID=1176131 RepID=A0A6G1HES7_9PEZI|nr:alpha/beta-hydrolase [Aulographum hederae CBS 113979]